MVKTLIIDDDNEFRAMLREMLEKAGYNNVKEAENGNIGVKLFSEDPFDLVITDIIMPDKEGIETIMELRKDCPSLKIIAMSGGAAIGDSRSYLSLAGHLGADRMLEKPFKRSELINTIQELLSE
jgi:CheY-like chemotaxis protein